MKSSGYDNNKLQTTYETTFGGTPDNDKKHEKIEGNLANKQKNHTDRDSCFYVFSEDVAQCSQISPL